ncbi:AMP-binding protein [Tistrella mobilis]|uniref:AMP-binding domain protein n=1 Tax=Tistrella mobilis (strain KA081020-065) TaxID=1110502 RepID=I3TT85_TISMK|nr:AMP-binding protein [Tistrella mobilis]AFK55973.1 AMP-binding domain protein [Tistrella mobilis KA081020-065]
MTADAHGGRPRHLPPFRSLADVEALERDPIDSHLTGRTMTGVLAHAARTHGDRIAACYLADPADPEGMAEEIGFAAFFRRAMQAAVLFRSLGLTRTEAVGCLLPALPQTVEIGWGAAHAGRIMPVNPFLEPAIIGAMLGRAGAAILCIEGPSGRDGTWEKLPAILAAAPAIRHVLVVGEPAAPDGVLHYETLRAAADPAEAGPEPAPGDIAACFHTGGTTGLPKIAPLTHYNLACMSLIAGYGAGLRAGDTLTNGMPLFHVGALVMGALAPFAHGCRVVQLGRRGYRDPSVMAGLWDIFGRVRPDIAIGPPTVVAAATQSFAAPPGDTGLRAWISSASSLPAEVHRRFTDRTGVPIKEAWGLTEATLVLTYMPPDGESRPGSVGLRLPWCEVRVARVADGRVVELLPAGTAGAIIARSPSVFPGYLDPAANRGVLLEDGWLDTGDMGVMDADGFLTITGRAKDVIIRGGHNIDPALIEEPLNAHPDVALGAAVGLPDARLGEVPVAFVTLKRGSSRSGADILAELAPTIAERAAIPRWIEVLPALPMTAVGKVHKPGLRREACRRAAAACLGLDPDRIGAEDLPGGRIAVILPFAAGSAAFDQAAATLAGLGLDARPSPAPAPEEPRP